MSATIHLECVYLGDRQFLLVGYWPSGEVAMASVGTLDVDDGD